MDFSLDDEQQLIVETASRFLAEAGDSKAMRAASESEDGIDRGLWRAIAELGWCGVHLPEHAGGLGLGIVELVLLQEQLGRRLACVPFFDSVVLAATLLRELGSTDLLPMVASGEQVMTLAADLRDGVVTPRARATTLEGGSWRLDGDWPRVGSAAVADTLLLPATTESGEWLLFALAQGSDGMGLTPLTTLDQTRRCADVQARAATLPATACIARGAALQSALQRTLDLGAIALAAEQLGGAQQCLDLTVAYAGERVQFDRPIASFQAVKHRCAQMLVAVEGARSAVYGAACIADDAATDAAALRLHAALARCEAIDAARFCAQESIQLHGGIGFTWELDLHWHFKRAQAASQRLGPASWWLEQVAAQLLDNEHEAPLR